VAVDRVDEGDAARRPADTPTEATAHSSGAPRRAELMERRPQRVLSHHG